MCYSDEDLTFAKPLLLSWEYGMFKESSTLWQNLSLSDKIKEVKRIKDKISKLSYVRKKLDIRSLAFTVIHPCSGFNL